MSVNPLLKSACALVLAAPLAPAQTIPNPSFEAEVFGVSPGYVAGNTSITGWTTPAPNYTGLNPIAGGGAAFANNGAIPAGTHVAFIQSAVVGNSLSTTATGLVAGTSYRVDFRANTRSGNTVTPAILTGPISQKWSLNGSLPSFNHTITAVGGSNPYHRVSFVFTASGPSETLTITNSESGDHTLLVDDFRIEVLSAWTRHPWNGDATSGLSPETTLWAYQFNTTTLGNINGVSVIGAPGTTPSFPGRYAVTGTSSLYTDDSNTLTALGGLGSGQMAKNFIYNGNPTTITLQNLFPGQGYRVTLFGAGFGAAGLRPQTFASGSDLMVIDENEYGPGKGMRIEYDFIASSPERVISITPSTAGTFHLYGLALGSTSAFHLAGPATMTVECGGFLSDPGAVNGPLAIAAGRYSSIGVRHDGSIEGWAAVPLTLGDVVAIDIGEANTGLTANRDGTVASWGSFSDVPAGLGNVVSVAAGTAHALALKRDGTVAQWGSTAVPNPPAGLNNVVAIAAGHYVSAVIKNDGTIVAWIGGTTARVDVVPAGLSEVVDIKAERNHAIALRRDGTVVCWGNIGPWLTIPAGLTNVVQVAAGMRYSAALKSDGSVVVWGYMSDLPPDHYVSISGGYEHLLGLTADGRVNTRVYASGPENTVPASLYQPAGQVSGNVQVDVLGTYPLTYTLPVPPNAVTLQRSVIVQDTTPPAVSLIGANPLVLTDRTFADPGATADDICAGTTPVTVSGAVNPNFPGIYTLTYESTDPSGNTGSAQRQIAVALPPVVPGDTDGDGEVSEAEFTAIRSALPDELGFLNAAGYYTEAQLKSLRGTGALLRPISPGRFQLTLGLRKSTDLTGNSFAPLPLLGPDISVGVDPEGKLEIQFPSPENAAFFLFEGN